MHLEDFIDNLEVILSIHAHVNIHRRKFFILFLIYTLAAPGLPSFTIINSELRT